MSMKDKSITNTQASITGGERGGEPLPFWDVMPWSLVQIYQNSGETYCLLHTGRILKIIDKFLSLHVITSQRTWNLTPVDTMFLITGTLLSRGRDSSVGIATHYGLDGPGIESRWGRDFPHPSRPALGPTQPPVQWVPGLSRG